MRRELCKRQGRERPPVGELIGVRRDVGGEMAKPRKLPELPYGSSAPAKGGASALKVVLVGTLVAFGGYSAIAGASMLSGLRRRAPDRPSRPSRISTARRPGSRGGRNARRRRHRPLRARRVPPDATPLRVGAAGPPSGSFVAVAAVAPGAPARQRSLLRHRRAPRPKRRRRAG